VNTSLRTARSLLALLALGFAGYVGAVRYSQQHRASETAVLHAIIDSRYTFVLPDSIPGVPEVMLHDHFDDVHGEQASDVAEWVTDSLPDVPRDLIRDFARVATDRSRIEPFELGRGKLHLLADSTLARFFGRHRLAGRDFIVRFRTAVPLCHCLAWGSAATVTGRWPMWGAKAIGWRVQASFMSCTMTAASGASGIAQCCGYPDRYIAIGVSFPTWRLRRRSVRPLYRASRRWVARGEKIAHSPY
jgi:hypothetical protein